MFERCPLNASFTIDHSHSHCLGVVVIGEEAYSATPKVKQESKAGYMFVFCRRVSVKLRKHDAVKVAF